MMARKKRKSNSSFGAYFGGLAALFVIIFLFVSGIFKLPNPQTNDDKQNQQQKSNNNTGVELENPQNNDKHNTKKYYKGDEVSGLGKIYKIDYNLNGAYQNKLTSSTDEFYVKSEQFILDDFANKEINFKGKIVTYASDDTPVLNITEIEKIEQQDEPKPQETEEKQETTPNDNKYLSKNGIILNFQGTDYFVKTTDSGIIVYQNDSNSSGAVIEIASISPYKCEVGSNLYDCDKFKNERAKIFKYATSTNDQGVIFYKMSETNQYVVIGEKYGYNIEPKSDDFNKILNAISLENFQAKTQELIRNTCQDSKIKLTEILDIKQNDENYEVLAFDQNSNKVTCKLTISGTDQMIGKLNSLKYVITNVNTKESNKNSIMLPETKETKKVTTTTVKENTNEVNTDVTKQEKADTKKELENQLEGILTEGLNNQENSTKPQDAESEQKQQKDEQTGNLKEDEYLIFKSRGYPYTLYMPKAVKYESLVSKENFGISGIECKQATNIADWKTGDLADPNLQVFYCKSSISSDDVKSFLKQESGNFQVRGTDEKIFIIKHKNDETSLKMLNYLKTF